MTTPFDAVADRLGNAELNDFAVRHGLHRDDPAWAGAVVMLPVLDAIQSATSRLPDAGIVAMAIVDKVAVGVADAVAMRVAVSLDSIEERQRDLALSVGSTRVVMLVALAVAFTVGIVLGILLAHVA